MPKPHTKFRTVPFGSTLIDAADCGASTRHASVRSRDAGILRSLSRSAHPHSIVARDTPRCGPEHATIPATNNASEQALRPCVFRKVTNCLRSEWGATLYADIRSVVEAARRYAVGAFQAIRLTLAPSR